MPLGRKPSRQNWSKTLEDLCDQIPFGPVLYRFVAGEGKGIREGFVAFVLLGAIAFVGGFKCGGRQADKVLANAVAENSNLVRQNDNLTRDLQLYQQRNTDLQVTVAPLLARAAKEFPGEEINQSLKRIIEKLDKDSSLVRPIRSAFVTVNVELFTSKPSNVLAIGGAVASVGFGKRTEKLLYALSLNMQSREIEKTKVFEYSFTCPTAAPDSPYIGKPVLALLDAEYIQVEFVSGVETGTAIVGGRIVWTINGDTSLTFVIPPQRTTDSRVYVRNLKSGFLPLMNNVR